ncbi:OmpH family outer membrane protein [Edaphocola aurantiacus]|jgi:outer membrane protein|uniref:OmpH family outer membrane protein n=1 Tax=Edaphocola aurantiacus TaxID=2601682 RepID=UPI001C93BEEA|nr:OmpH family outer membrane protein [Edaphocola aurantiacus]
MRKIFVLAIVGVLMTIGASAQKIGYVNASELLATMPDMVKANKDLEVYAKTFEDAGKTMMTEYQTKADAFTKGEKTMSEAVKEVKYKEIMDLQKRIQDYDQSSQDKIEKKREELIKPVLEKAQKAIKDYGTANGYDYILNSEGILYAKDADNVTAQIKAKLGAK